jgi:hypothetical protein
MFFGLMLGEFVLGLVILFTIVGTWPNVPWDTLGWAVPLGMLVMAVPLIPVAKVVWLTIDVLVRPVTREELVP